VKAAVSEDEKSSHSTLITENGLSLLFDCQIIKPRVKLNLSKFLRFLEKNYLNASLTVNGPSEMVAMSNMNFRFLSPQIVHFQGSNFCLKIFLEKNRYCIFLRQEHNK
jgi:hypothetical protein